MSSIIGAVSSLIGGILYGNVSYASPLLLVAGTTFLTTLIGALFVREPKQREE
jgi:hypothetical protein